MLQGICRKGVEAKGGEPSVYKYMKFGVHYGPMVATERASLWSAPDNVKLVTLALLQTTRCVAIFGTTVILGLLLASCNLNRYFSLTEQVNTFAHHMDGNGL
jgi:hypothetical protein